MRILIVSSFLPFPLFSGGHIRLFNLIKKLSEKHEIILIGEQRDYQTQDDLKELKKICKEIISVPRQKQWSIQTILKTGLSTYPFLMTGHTSNNFKEKIQNVLDSNKIDLIHVETFYVMQNLPKTDIPVVLIEHNIEYLVYQRYLQRVPVVFRPFLLIDIIKIKYWENKFWKRANKVICVSEEEKKFIGRPDTEIVPNGVDLEKFKIHPFDKSFDRELRPNRLRTKFKVQKVEKRMLFIGDFKWIQNRDAVEWILKEIWPKINGRWRIENGSLTLWIVGRNIPSSIKNLSNDANIVFDENASKDTFEIFKKADILLSPIRVGGGTSFKILEAMASGVPVITTKLGIEGIDAKNNKEVLLAENANEFSDQVINTLDNEKLYSDVVKNARKLIEEKYDWKIIVKKLEEVYGSVVIK